MKHTIAITIDTDRLASVTDTYLAQLWHVAQANPAPYGDRDAGDLTEKIGREIIRRWLVAEQPDLYAHQGRDYYCKTLSEHGAWENGVWTPNKAAAE